MTNTRECSPLEIAFPETHMGYRPEPLPTDGEYRAKFRELYAYHLKRHTPEDRAKECVTAYLTSALWPGFVPPDGSKGGEV
ncbi:hypothetical protein AGMMS49942_03560 [Spirochaetia bacterium]|nr:hypothetical protein AGMMS49942_03560 [Spirochaetia bacterium]